MNTMKQRGFSFCKISGLYMPNCQKVKNWHVQIWAAGKAMGHGPRSPQHPSQVWWTLLMEMTRQQWQVQLWFQIAADAAVSEVMMIRDGLCRTR